MNLGYLFIALRPKQWIKNLFIFLPLVFGKKLFLGPAFLNSAIAFCLFSLAASASYLINDIVDIKEDSLHPSKRLRPITSGQVSVRGAWIIAFILIIFSISLSFNLNLAFGWTLVAYLIFNILYSIFLKGLVIIDVFCIAGFFLARIIAGLVVTEVEFSHWMIMMTVFLALFLGFNKRRQELTLLHSDARFHRPVLRKYSIYFIDQMVTVATASIIITYMLYTVDSRTQRIFGTRDLIYSTPFVYYGLFRYLYLVQKKHTDGDPTRILLSDKMLQLDIILWLIVCIGVIYFWI